MGNLNAPELMVGTQNPTVGLKMLVLNNDGVNQWIVTAQDGTKLATEVIVRRQSVVPTEALVRSAEIRAENTIIRIGDEFFDCRRVYLNAENNLVLKRFNSTEPVVGSNSRPQALSRYDIESCTFPQFVLRYYLAEVVFIEEWGHWKLCEPRK